MKNYQIIDNINITLEYEVYNICYLNDGSILTGHFNGIIKQWDLNNDKLKYIGKKKFMMIVLELIIHIKFFKIFNNIFFKLCKNN